MKYLILAVLLSPLVASAQNALQTPPQRRQLQPGPISATEMFADNYQITLTTVDKDSPPVEVSIVVGSAQFNTALASPSLTFSGTLNVEDSGSLVLAYALGWQHEISSPNGNIQYHSSSIQSAVRLKAGEEIQILRAGQRTLRLSIKKVDAPKAQ